MRSKTIMKLAAAWLVFSTLNPQSSTCYAQGGLTPPGAPTPTMKSLDQIYQRAEPRVDVLSLSGDGFAKYVISQRGAYYLSSNLVGTAGLNGINIITNDVQLDLAGFTMIGVSNRTAIITTANGIQRIRIENGRLAGWKSGVDFYVNGYGSNLVVANVQMALTGESFGNGIIARDTVSAYRCMIQGANGSSTDGIFVSPGTGCVIESSQFLQTGGGVLLGNNAIVRGCQVIDCTDNTGINVGNGSLVTENVVRGSKGIRIDSASVASRNVVQGSVGATGVTVRGSNSRVEENQVVGGNSRGIDTDSGTTNNLIIRNFASGNTGGNYNYFGAAVSGPLVTSSGVISTNNPWANFSLP